MNQKECENMEFSKEIVIEGMKEEDLSQIQELYLELLPDGLEWETLRENYRKATTNENYCLLVAKREQEVIGTAMGILNLALDAPFLVVENVVVKDTLRGQGVGRMLFQALDDFAKENQCGYAILVSSGFRKGAHAFYEAMGYNDEVRGFRKLY